MSHPIEMPLIEQMRQLGRSFERIVHALATIDHKTADALSLAALQDIPYRKMLRRELVRASRGTRKANEARDNAGAP
jgi:hypothetical protein